jgi:methylthioribose-1-phosphate isomerase
MRTNSITITPPASVVEWVGGLNDGRVRLLDQTALPQEVSYIECSSTEELWDAIKRLAVRGAPAIGVAAGYGMVLAAREAARVAKTSGKVFSELLAQKGQYLKSCRPTAVNLAWAVERAADAARGALPDRAAERVLAEAREIHREDAAMCRAIGEHAAALIRRCSGVLTHCNAGALATAGIGTATAGMYVAHAAGHPFCVYCDETRPLLQGSRLTAWELTQAGINAVVVTDNMAAQVMREGRVQLVITGADRIAANGDTANKIGTYGLAILAAYHGIPFYVAAPVSTFDLALENGSGIPIEQRGAEEITEGLGRRTAPDGIAVYAPAFDVTPAALITGIITDRGIIQPVNPGNIRQVLEGSQKEPHSQKEPQRTQRKTEDTEQNEAGRVKARQRRRRD